MLRFKLFNALVTGIGWTPVAPTNGNLVLFSATIANRGTAPTPAGVVIGVGFFVDGVKTNWYGVLTDPLAPGQSRHITIYLRAAANDSEACISSLLPA